MDLLLAVSTIALFSVLETPFVHAKRGRHQKHFASDYQHLNELTGGGQPPDHDRNKQYPSEKLPRDYQQIGPNERPTSSEDTAGPPSEKHPTDHKDRKKPTSLLQQPNIDYAASNLVKDIDNKEHNPKDNAEDHSSKQKKEEHKTNEAANNLQTVEMKALGNKTDNTGSSTTATPDGRRQGVFCGILGLLC